jgi:hypothetical protein
MPDPAWCRALNIASQTNELLSRAYLIILIYDEYGISVCISQQKAPAAMQ